MADLIRVNLNQLSWGSIIFKAANERWTGFTAITYADKRERVKAYGMGRHHAPRGRSRGKYSTDPVKVTGWKGSVQMMREALAALSVDGVSYGDVEFEAAVEYIDTGDLPIYVEINGCVWMSNSASDDESPDPLKEDFELDVMAIRRNGVTLFDSSQGSPV